MLNPHFFTHFITRLRLYWLITMVIVITVLFVGSVFIHCAMAVYEQQLYLANTAHIQQLATQHIMRTAYQMTTSPATAIRPTMLVLIKNAEARQAELLASKFTQNQLREMFFAAPYSVDEKFQSFLDAARRLTKMPDSQLDSYMPEVEYIQKQNAALQTALGAAVREYDALGVQTSQWIQIFNWLRMIIVLAILLLQFGVIMRPMMRRLKANAHELQTEIQQRRETEATRSRLEELLIERALELEKLNLALSESEKRYRLLAENATDLISLHNTEGHYLYISPNSLALLGYAPETMIGISVGEFCHPEDVPLLDKIHTIVLQTPAVQTATFRLQRQDGQYIWVESTVRSVWGNDGKVTDIIAISRDITQRMMIEHELQSKDLFITRVLSAIPDVVYVQDIHGKQTLYSNRSLYRLLGYQPDDIAALGVESFTQLMHPDDLGRLPEQWAQQRQAQDDDIIEFEYRLLDRDSHWVWVRSREVVFDRDMNGMPHQILTTIQDLTQEKRAAQQQVELETERQQRVMMAEFIQNASHDFRTPLTIIANSAYLMSRLPDEQKRTEKANRIQAQIHHLESILDDMLLMAQLDTQQEIDRQKVSVNMLIRDYLMGMSFKQEIQFVPEEPLPPVMGNAYLLNKALAALLKNAQAYTPADGVITISTYHKQDTIEIMVHNTGEVIPEAVLPHIFERFFRGDTGRSPGKGGAGLGLTITRKIVEQHDGAITAESSAEHGTRFIICLPTGLPAGTLPNKLILAVP